MRLIDSMASIVRPTNLISVVEANFLFASYVPPPSHRNHLHSSSTVRLPHGHINAARVSKMTESEFMELWGSYLQGRRYVRRHII